MTQVLENLVGSMPSSMSSMYNTIDQYAVGTAVLYSSGNPIVNNGNSILKSDFINKSYGIHENKYIDNSGITTVYTNFELDGVNVGVWHNDLLTNHKEKVPLFKDKIDYKDI